MLWSFNIITATRATTITKRAYKHKSFSCSYSYVHIWILLPNNDDDDSNCVYQHTYGFPHTKYISTIYSLYSFFVYLQLQTSTNLFVMAILIGFSLVADCLNNHILHYGRIRMRVHMYYDICFMISTITQSYVSHSLFFPFTFY